MLETVYPGESRYIIIGNTSKPRMTYLYENVEYYVNGSKELDYVLLNVSDYQKIFIHFLKSGIGFEKINHPNMYWIIWGGDLYEGLICQKGYKIYIDEDEQFRVRAAQSPIGRIPVWLYKFIVKIRDYSDFKNRYKIIKKIKGVIAIKEDYKLLKEYCPKLNVEYAHFFSYYPIEKQIGAANLDKECSGLNIWVGNSPALNGNQSSIFKILKDYPESLKIYCPISYGDHRLIEYIDKIGNEILGKKFVPLKNFMTADKYFENYFDANAFIFGHLRQCGMGSVMMALYLGGKCFLYSRSPLYSFFKRKGLIIFSIENDLNYQSTQIPLSREERKKNRELIRAICSSETIKKQMKIVFS